MVNYAKKLINRLTKWVNMQKRVASSRRQKVWGRVCARITSIFSFPTHTRAHFAMNYKKITKHFQCGYKTKTKLKHITHYAIFQNRRICASCQIIWLGALCGLCILLIYKWLAFCGLRLFAWLIRLFMRSWLVWAVRD